MGEGSSVERIAAGLGTNGRVTEMLLNAITALGLLVKQDGNFRNTPVTRRFFAGQSPDNARAALLHTAHLWSLGPT